VMEIGSVPIQNVATQTSRGELSVIAVTKNDLKEWEVEINLVSLKIQSYEPRNFLYVFIQFCGCFLIL
jgi:hypothetical protein